MFVTVWRNTSRIFGTHCSVIFLLVESMSASFLGLLYSVVDRNMLSGCTWCCSPSEVKKLTDVFSRMFSDPSAKVFTLYVETLPSFLQSHADDISPEWVHVCLSCLLTRVSGEQFSSAITRLHKALNAARWFHLFGSVNFKVITVGVPHPRHTKGLIKRLL